MKKLFLLSLLLWSISLPASTVIWIESNWLIGAYATNATIITPINPLPNVLGAFFNAGPPQRFPVTNSAAAWTNNLARGFYRLDIENVPFSKPPTFWVPNDTNTYFLEQLMEPNTPLFVNQLVAGSSITLNPSSGFGKVTISTAPGNVTNLNVLAFGADPYFTNSDSTAAIQAALNIAATNSGGDVFVPPGRYKIGTTVPLIIPSTVTGVPAGNVPYATNQVNLYGLGTQSILDGSSNNNPILIYNAGTNSSWTLTRCSAFTGFNMRDLAFNKLSGPSAISSAPSIWVFNTLTNQIDCVPSVDNTFKNIQFNGGSYQICASNVTWVTLKLENCHFQGYEFGSIYANSTHMDSLKLKDSFFKSDRTDTNGLFSYALYLAPWVIGTRSDGGVSQVIDNIEVAGRFAYLDGASPTIISGDYEGASVVCTLTNAGTYVTAIGMNIVAAGDTNAMASNGLSTNGVVFDCWNRGGQNLKWFNPPDNLAAGAGYHDPGPRMFRVHHAATIRERELPYWLGATETYEALTGNGSANGNPSPNLDWIPSPGLTNYEYLPSGYQSVTAALMMELSPWVQAWTGLASPAFSSLHPFFWNTNDQALVLNGTNGMPGTLSLSNIISMYVNATIGAVLEKPIFTVSGGTNLIGVNSSLYSPGGGGSLSLNWASRLDVNSSGAATIDWQNQLLLNNSTNVLAWGSNAVVVQSPATFNNPLNAIQINDGTLVVTNPPQLNLISSTNYQGDISLYGSCTNFQVETPVYTNANSMSYTNNLTMETVVTVAGATNYLFQDWDTFFRNGGFSYSNVLSLKSSGAWMGSRWALNSAGQAVLYITGGLTNEDATFLARSKQQWTTNGVSPFTPMNIPGYPAYTYYVATGSGNYSTNSNTADWKNLVAANPNLDLTNQNSTAANYPNRVAGGLNGLDYLSFNGNLGTTHLVNDLYTSTQPFEVIGVLSWTNSGANTYLWDSHNSSYRLYTFYDTTSGGRLDVVNGLNGNPIFPTNTWLVVDIAFNGVNTTIYTNGVLNVTGDGGSSTLSGFVLGWSFNLSGGSQFTCAELVTYKTNLTAYGRSQDTSYERTKYGF